MSSLTNVGPVPASRTNAGKARKPRKPRSGLMLGVLAWLIGIAFIVPILWMVLTSFHSESDAATNPPSIAAPLTLQGYREFFGASSGASPWPSLANSMTASVLSTALVLLLALPAAYAPSACWQAPSHASALPATSGRRTCSASSAACMASRFVDETSNRWNDAPAISWRSSQRRSICSGSMC